MYKQLPMANRTDRSVSSAPIARDATNVPTACCLCSQNCGLRVDVVDGRISAVRPDKDSPITHGYACNKGFTIPQYVEHAQRVTEPLRRRSDGSFEAISWDTAIAEIAAKLSAIRKDHGGSSIALCGGGGQGNHLDAPYALSFLRGVGSRRWFNAFAQEKTQHNLLDQMMFCATPAAMLAPDEDHSACLLVFGSNPKISNRGHNATDALKEFRRDDSRDLIVVDPRETETARGADVHLRVKPGGDYALLLGLVTVVVRDHLGDETFLAKYVSQRQELVALVDGLELEDLARRSGVSVEQLTDVATRFAQAKTASIAFDLGVEHTVFSTLNAYLMRVLLVLTGNVGNRGGNLFHQGVNCPDPRGLEQGKTDRARVSAIPGIRALGSYAMFSPSLLPEETLCDHPDRIRALIVEGSNPLLSFSDTQKWRDAFERLELSVVIEPAMTETAQAADYVLSVPVGYEKWEISTFPKHMPEIHAQLRPPVVSPPAKALTEAEIFARIAGAMNLFGELPRPLAWLSRWAARPRVRHAATALGMGLAAVAERSPQVSVGVQSRVIFWLYAALGPSLPAPSVAAVWLICVKNAVNRREAVLRTLGAEHRYRDPFALAELLYQRLLDHPEGVEIACLDLSRNLEDHIGFEDGKIRLAPADMLAEICRALATPVEDERFPMVLAAGLRTRWTANTIHRDPSWRKGKGPHCDLWIHPDDATRLGIANGETVTLETSRGSARLPATHDARMLPGQVAVPNGFGMTKADGSVDGVNLNELTDAMDRDPFTGCPHHKHVRCSVTPVA